MELLRATDSQGLAVGLLNGGALCFAEVGRELAKIASLAYLNGTLCHEAYTALDQIATYCVCRCGASRLACLRNRGSRVANRTWLTHDVGGCSAVHSSILAGTARVTRSAFLENSRIC